MVYLGCAGGFHYPGHVQWWANYAGTPPRVATEPGIGYRTDNARIAHEGNVVKPKDASDEFQVEGELVAVIGKTAKHLSTRCSGRRVTGSTCAHNQGIRACPSVAIASRKPTCCRI